MNKIKCVGGYLRVSTTEQALKGLSLEAQEAAIKEYCEKNGYKLVGFYVDRGITARKKLSNRTEFMRMMEDVQSGKINHIVVIRLDRFFRNVYDYHRMMHEYLEPNNCGWSAVMEDYDTTTTNGRLMINLRLAIAEQECDQDSDRIKDVFVNRVANGYAISGSQPIGLKIEDHRVVPDEENRHIAVDMFETMARLGSIRATTTMINEKYGIGLPYTSVRRHLKNKLYIGEYRGNPNYCEAIIDRDTFDAVQRLSKMNTRVRRNKRIYIFSSLLTCTCGRRLSGSMGSTRGYGFYYRCNNNHQNHTCSNNHRLSELRLERYLLENVEEQIRGLILVADVQETNNAPTVDIRKGIEKKMARLNDLYVDGYVSMEKFKADYQSLAKQLEEIKEEPKRDTAKLKEFLNSGFREIYSGLTRQEKQSLWRSIIKEIRIERDKIVSVDFL